MSEEETQQAETKPKKVAKPKATPKKVPVAAAPKAVPKATKKAAGNGVDYQQLAAKFKHISDATRLQVVSMLANGELHVGAMCDELSQSQPAVSHHLALLRHGGIITPRRQGKNNFYGLTTVGEKLVTAINAFGE
jgi:DNA-binding transcriptional ArsR family regulator